VTHTAIAIDGPAASGKSTVAGILAERLGYLYLDTGVMYRAVAWAALERGIPIEDEVTVTDLAERLRIEVQPSSQEDGRPYTVLADGQDITWEIRSDAVNRAVSPVSAYRGVRLAMTAQQRRVAAHADVIMAGRDIGTVVLPEAPVKIYLDASVDERARRRQREMQARGLEACFQTVLRDLQRRDRIDSTRQEAPLRIPDGAILVDTTPMSIDEVVTYLETIIRQRLEPESHETRG
jgi:cytidylate kinase